MIDDYFWLSDEQFCRLEPLLLTDMRGKPRIDDRRVISGIVHVLKFGSRWVVAPETGSAWRGAFESGCLGYLTCRQDEEEVHSTRYEIS